MRPALAVYGYLLRALPRTFRARFGADMSDMVRVRAEVEGVRTRAALFWTREYLDLLRTVVREWWALVRASRGRRGSVGGGGGPASDLPGDVRHAIRGMVRSPGFSAVVILTLALGIGVNAAVFSLVDTVVLRALPYHETRELVRVRNVDRAGGAQAFVSYADYLDYRDRATAFVAIEGYRGSERPLSGDEREPRRVHTALVTRGLFDLLGVSPALGRGFVPDDYEPGGPASAVVSYSFWQRRFGGRPEALGRSITLDGVPHTVVGVMPPDFDYPYLADMVAWTPLIPRTVGEDAAGAEVRDFDRLLVLGRLRDPAARVRAERDLSTIAARLAEAFPETNAGLGIRVTRLDEDTIGWLRRPMMMLLAAVGVILAVACVNAAGLLLARGTVREGEVAVRAALGASRGRLMRLFLVESALYAGIGGLLGLGVAQALISVVPRIPFRLPRLDDVSLDARVIAAMVLVTLGTTLAVGLVPALRGSRTNLRDALGTQRGMVGLPRNRLQRGLVVFEIALSTVLVAAAGLLTHSFLRTVREDPGFEPDRVLTMRIALREVPTEDPGEAREGALAFFEDLAARVARTPGVEAVALSSVNPIEAEATFTPNAGNVRFGIVGGADATASSQPRAYARTVTPGFFRVVGVPLRAGRDFEPGDRKGAEGVAVVNEAFVRRYLEGADPLGRSLTGPDLAGPDGYPASWRIVGVVGDVKSAGLAREPWPIIYRNFAQTPARTMRLLARTRVDPRSLVSAIRQRVWEADPDLPVDDLLTMDEVVARSVAVPRLAMVSVGAFGLVALLFASIGVYGVLAFFVSLRTPEFGLRRALGADRRSIFVLVLRHGSGLAAAGIGAGLVTAFLANRLLAATLYGVAPSDPPTYAVVTLILGSVAAVACYVPAARATRVDPVRTLGGDGSSGA